MPPGSWIAGPRHESRTNCRRSCRTRRRLFGFLQRLFRQFVRQCGATLGSVCVALNVRQLRCVEVLLRCFICTIHSSGSGVESQPGGFRARATIAVLELMPGALDGDDFRTEPFVQGLTAPLRHAPLEGPLVDDPCYTFSELTSKLVRTRLWSRHRARAAVTERC